MVRENKFLEKAKKSKNDEFYTLLVDIEKELKYYKKFFKGKIVFCNCDDPYESNFFKYFALNFNNLGLKKLISTSYASSPVVGKEIGLFEHEGKEYRINNKRAYKVVVSEIKINNEDGGETLDDIKGIIRHRIRYLKEDGDFRSEECIELLKEADVVVTNPPFSMFREYVAQLMEYNKQFLIIGNINAITYKEIFALIKNNKVWLGHGMGRWISGFIVPDKYELYGTEARIENNQRIVSTNNCLWLTNIDFPERHNDIKLFRRYNPEDYPTYDNYEAIEVSKTTDIPYDYDGIMGVPISYMDKFNPEQFEIIACSAFSDEEYFGCGSLYVGGKKKYARILIRRKKEGVEDED